MFFYAVVTDSSSPVNKQALETAIITYRKFQRYYLPMFCQLLIKFELQVYPNLTASMTSQSDLQY